MDLLPLFRSMLSTRHKLFYSFFLLSLWTLRDISSTRSTDKIQLPGPQAQVSSIGQGACILRCPQESLRSLEKANITLLTKVYIAKAIVYPVVMNECKDHKEGRVLKN